MLTLDNRARKLSDMVGQKLIIHEMQNRSKEKEFAQSMIMEGNTGSGKTTLALIIASLLNCKEPVKNEGGYFDPCGECVSCQDIYSEQFHRDVFLYDASAMGKDDVLNLQKKASIQGWSDRNKIFIIDEAQALSKAGLGATLALLEKKRKNTYFILCTMDRTVLEKAIKGRCQTYQFRSVNDNEIAKYLYDVIENREIEVPDDFIKNGLFLISEFANGSVREALQYLERCIYGNYFDVETISQELGFISKDDMIELIDLLLKKDVEIFKRLSKVDMKAFFRYSYAILIDALAYKVSGHMDKKWKKNSYTQIISYKTLSDLIAAYNKQLQSCENYFNNKFFTFNLLDYYLGSKETLTPILSNLGGKKRTPIA